MTVDESPSIVDIGPLGCLYTYHDCYPKWSEVKSEVGSVSICTDAGKAGDEARLSWRPMRMREDFSDQEEWDVTSD